VLSGPPPAVLLRVVAVLARIARMKPDKAAIMRRLGAAVAVVSGALSIAVAPSARADNGFWHYVTDSYGPTCSVLRDDGVTAGTVRGIGKAIVDYYGIGDYLALWVEDEQVNGYCNAYYPAAHPLIEAAQQSRIPL
jgi:hypothetical protein